MDTGQATSGRGSQDTGRGAATAKLLLDHGFLSAAACSALGVAMVVARWEWTGSIRYLFLVWNLFLAWLPWLFSLPLATLPSRRGHGWKLLPLLGLWLLFLPNAPYIVTDLLHLRAANGVPVWFDAALLFTFAWTGCLLGFFSLRIAHGRIEAWLGAAAGWLFVFAAAVLTGFGIYLGRFLRWNSWDIVSQPGALARDILDRVLSPGSHPQTWLVTAFFAAFFVCAYAAFAHRPRPIPARSP